MEAMDESLRERVERGVRRKDRFEANENDEGGYHLQGPAGHHLRQGIDLDKIPWLLDPRLEEEGKEVEFHEPKEELPQGPKEAQRDPKEVFPLELCHLLKRLNPFPNPKV